MSKARPKSSAPRASEFDDTPAVTALLNALKHPMKATIEEIRSAILASDKSITEGIKWNTASFYCHGWFATINLRAKAGVQIILHHGAKIRDDGGLKETIEDSAGLLQWLAPDRASVTFLDADDFKSRQSAFKKIIKQWARHQAQAT